jgi:hypothetical protein
MPKDRALNLTRIASRIRECVCECASDSSDDPIHFVDIREERRFISRFIKARLVSNDAFCPSSVV